MAIERELGLALGDGLRRVTPPLPGSLAALVDTFGPRRGGRGQKGAVTLAAKELGVTPRTVERWMAQESGAARQTRRISLVKYADLRNAGQREIWLKKLRELAARGGRITIKCAILISDDERIRPPISVNLPGGTWQAVADRLASSKDINDAAGVWELGFFDAYDTSGFMADAATITSVEYLDIL